MKQNNNQQTKRPVLVQDKQPAKRPAGASGRTVGERQRMSGASRQAMSMANKKGPTIQERAEAHRRAAQNEQLHVVSHPSETVPNKRAHTTEKAKRSKKKNAVKAVKKTSVFKKLFVQENAILGTPDFLILEIVAALLVIGLVMVFSASSYRSLLEYGSAFHYFINQLVAAVLGVIAMAIVTFMNPEWFRKLAPYILFFVLLLLIYTMFRGEETLGAQRWVTIAGLRFTPSELAKPLMVICAADLVKNGPYEVIRGQRNIIVFAMLIVTAGIVAVEDLGSALAIVGGCFAIFIVSGLNKRGIFAVLGSGLIIVAGYCLVEPYRIQRLLGFLNQTEADAANGSAYQLVQSLYAFGSGGLFGVGIGNSGQKLLYLPGMHTDFIFSVIGEELGLVGALLVLGLFLAFAWRGFWIATRIEDTYKAYLAFGSAAIIAVQALINMGVAVGVLPVTGITLPFISYGGTSLAITMCIVGMLLNMSRYADKEKNTAKKRSFQVKNSSHHLGGKL